MTATATAQAPARSAAPTAVTITVRIHRYDPEVSDEPEWQSFDVPALPTDRVLNLLHHIKWYIDGTLSFRRSCAHGVCGSDAMRINGVLGGRHVLRSSGHRGRTPVHLRLPR
jgi:succinate dehydrogenase / fumarate reductase iron-sulfur subunit